MPKSKAPQQLPQRIMLPETEAAHFKVSLINEGNCSLSAFNRRDFYKITLVHNGCSQLMYADKDISVEGSALVFTNPLVPYSWSSEEMVLPDGYFCVFTDRFLQGGQLMNSLQESVLFKPGGNPVYLLNDEQTAYLTSIFKRMREEEAGEYLYKYDLLRSQVNMIIHEAIKMQPAVAYYNPPNAASRIAKLFQSLLEKQFPVASPQQALTLKKASDYAQKLAVHVNHLNAAVQEATGRSTTAHINERMVMEAQSLLLHTDWSVAEIAFSLGFEYPSYFNTFFKKQMGFTPMSLRKGVAAK